jgi:hypothetical protein
MQPQPQQAKSATPAKQYLEISPEDEAKIKARVAKHEATPKLTEENLLIAEFGMFYGYEAMRDAMSDEISANEFTWLLEAARRVDARNQYNLSAAVFTAVATANAKKPAAEFKKNTAHYLKAAKADA